MLYGRKNKLGDSYETPIFGTTEQLLKLFYSIQNHFYFFLLFKINFTSFFLVLLSFPLFFVILYIYLLI